MFIKFLKKTLWKILKVNPRAYKLKSIAGYKRKNNKNLTIMEIGSWKGNFSENLLKIFPQSELILVDPWKVSTINKDSWYGENKQNQESMEGIYKDVVKKFKSKKNVLIHRGTVKSFYESNHLTGDIDFVKIIKMIINEEKRRSIKKEVNIPMRPDHGHCLLDDQSKKFINPGYTAIGRMMGLSEIRGIIKSVNYNYK